MRARVLDTSLLIRHWRDRRSQSARGSARRQVRWWAQELIGWQGSDAIVTPVYIEFVAGVASEAELRQAREYLSVFRIIDEGRILPRDWVEARRLAERIPRSGKRRQLGDCLIRAIARRLRHDVVTLEVDFPG